MLLSLEAGRLKLDEYYSQTDYKRGYIYTISTMLAPDSRFQFFLTDDWTKEWREKYRASFQDALTPYQERQATSQGPSASSSGSRPNTVLNNLLRAKKPKAKPVGDEITQYLDGGKLILF